eukprot:9271692-Ditylum_brightwellii.AAC.1
MVWHKYMRILFKLIPSEFMDAYDLHAKVHNGYVYLEICKGIYGLPQASKMANDLLKQRLALYGYYEVSHTPGLWHHTHCPVTFTLVVDHFGIKFVGDHHLNHLLDILKSYYTLEVDYEGSRYCGITLKWNYDLCYLDINIHEYIAEQLI